MKTVTTDNAPAAIGPYSQATHAGNMLFVSGQISLDPKTGAVVGDTVESQAEKAIHNLIAIVRDAGFLVTDIAKINVYIRDMGKFAEFNEVYARELSGHKPARAVVEVSALPKGVLVELDAICVKE
jgi:2-iminobutanoate/2-iminopropanoate deaminase